MATQSATRRVSTPAAFSFFRPVLATRPFRTLVSRLCILPLLPRAPREQHARCSMEAGAALAFWRIILERLGERARDLAEDIAREDSEQFKIDARDFLSARERGGTTGTRIEQQTAALSDASKTTTDPRKRNQPVGAGLKPAQTTNRVT